MVNAENIFEGLSFQRFFKVQGSKLMGVCPSQEDSYSVQETLSSPQLDFTQSSPQLDASGDASISIPGGYQNRADSLNAHAMLHGTLAHWYRPPCRFFGRLGVLQRV